MSPTTPTNQPHNPESDAVSVAGTTLPAPPRRRRRSPWRLRILLAIDFVVLVLFVIARLDPAQYKLLAPAIEFVNQFLQPPDDAALSKPGQRFVDEVTALGGQLTVLARKPKFLGIFGTAGARESFQVWLYGPQVDDATLARLVGRYGDSISALQLHYTQISDGGLQTLQKLSNLRQLVLLSDGGSRGGAQAATCFTDAGLALLRIPTLTNLNLTGQSITDDGLKAVAGLPSLEQLYLTRTKIKGPGLTHLRSLSNLAVLHLDDAALNEESLSLLTAVPNLQVLSLNNLPMSAAALKHLAALPKLKQLGLHHCGLLDEEVKDFQATVPLLRIER
jgi:hypothetical protein